MNNRWFAEAEEGIRYFLGMIQDMFFTFQKKVIK